MGHMRLKFRGDIMSHFLILFLNLIQFLNKYFKPVSKPTIELHLTVNITDNSKTQIMIKNSGNVRQDEQ